MIHLQYVPGPRKHGQDAGPLSEPVDQNRRVRKEGQREAGNLQQGTVVLEQRSWPGVKKNNAYSGRRCRPAYTTTNTCIPLTTLITYG